MMSDDRMTRERFESLLDRHGGDLDAWPDRAAAAARPLILEDPEARRAYEAARRLDGLLAARLDAIESDQDLAERAVMAVAPALADPPAVERRRWIARLAASFLLALVIGGAAERIAWELPPSDDVQVAMLESLVYGLGEGQLP